MENLETQEEVVEVKTKGKPGRKPKAVVADQASPELIKMLMEQFGAMQRQQSEENLKLVQALKEPTELEAKKLREEQEARVKRAQMSVAAAKQLERAIAAKQAACRAENHADEKGNTRFRAQINSDGMIRPVCMKCQLQTAAIKAQPGQSSVDMWQWKGVSEETLNNMAKLSVGA